jgi:small redox-active disulfide protein 2
MSLFGFGKKKEDKENSCRCECGTAKMAQAEKSKSEGASVKVLGSGCEKCNALEAATKEALTELGMDTAIDHVTDFAQIATYGVMSTPALVIDGKVVSFGKVLKKDEVISILKKIR